MFMPDFTNYYHILNLPQTATDEEIRRSYKDFAKALHPDKNPNDPNATAAFQLLQQAYSTLSDPLKRSEYDLQQAHTRYTQARNEWKSRQASRAAAREDGTFDAEYEFRKHKEGMRHFFRSPTKPPPTAEELQHRKRQAAEWARQLERDTKSWEKAERRYAKADSERMKERVKKEGPIPEWLEHIEVEGWVDYGEEGGVMERDVMEGEPLIDFEEDLMGFDSPPATTTPSLEMKPDEFARPGERERRSSLGSQGRRAVKEARNEWDIFFDRFENSCTV